MALKSPYGERSIKYVLYCIVDSCHDNTQIVESLPHLNITGRHANAKIVQLLAQLSLRLPSQYKKDGEAIVRTISSLIIVVWVEQKQQFSFYNIKNSIRNKMIKNHEISQINTSVLGIYLSLIITGAPWVRFFR